MSDYNKFYSDLRACFKSNLRKAGDTILFKNNQKLEHDEKISPTTECLLVYMALERIDSRLPAEIDRIFGHRMDENVTLIDLQTEIFTYIPRALASLDREDSELNAYTVHNSFQNLPEPSTFQQQGNNVLEANAIYNQKQYSPQPRMPFRPAFRPNIRQQYTPRIASVNPRFNTKACKVCQALDLPPQVYNSHATNYCRRKSQLQQLDLEEQQSETNHYWNEGTECSDQLDD